MSITKYKLKGNLKTADNWIFSSTLNVPSPFLAFSPMKSKITSPQHAANDIKQRPTPIHNTVVTPPKWPSTKGVTIKLTALPCLKGQKILYTWYIPTILEKLKVIANANANSLLLNHLAQYPDCTTDRVSPPKLEYI